MSNKVFDIWSQLEETHSSGMVKRLYSSDFAINVYCVYKYPDESYGIAISFPKTIRFNLAPFSNLSELKVELFEDKSFNDCWLLTAIIINKDKKSEFSYLCENVLETLKDEQNIVTAVKVFGNKLLRWKNLFDKIRSNGLSKEEQQGLYGELRFLKKCLNANIDSAYNVVKYYVGTDKALRDFQGKDWAVEVKTTSTNNPQNVTINGERQLDDTMIENLYLFHCSVEITKLTGTTLPKLISDIRNIVDADVGALSLFNAKLFEAGYLDEQSNLYNNRHYKIRKESFYHVKDDFPRIREKELRNGVGNVKYGVALSACEQYSVTELEVLNKCLRHD